MALLSRERIGDEHLEKDWEEIGSGGFGYVYKTRHKGMGLDVAIKLVHHGARSMLPQETSLYKEASLMDQASFKYVLRVYGIYQGCPPVSGLAMQEGIVMEYMKRGSIQSLQEGLSGRPPWALAFRLAHQVALGMNFLHSKNLVHQDLKPNNVLLNDDLNAQLADFGLSTVSTSALRSDQEAEKLIGGTVGYMPPEAFPDSYTPVRSFDVYSYGILLYAIFSGKEPYPEGKESRLLKLRVRRGDRPKLEELDKEQAEGLKEILDLMQKCWAKEPDKRPLFRDIIKDTECVFKKHDRRVHDDVCKVLKILDSQSSSHSQPSVAASSTPETPGQSIPADVVDHLMLPTESSISVLTIKEKAKFVQRNMATIVQDTQAAQAIADELKSKGMIHSEAYSIIFHTSINQNKMREIYNMPLQSGGDVVKAAFYDALKTHEPFLMTRLGG